MKSEDYCHVNLKENFGQTSFFLIVLSIYFIFRFMVTQVSGEVEVVEVNKVLRAFNAVDLVVERRMVTLEWKASPVNDMYADAVLCAVLQAESMETPSYVPTTSASMKVDKMHFKVNVFLKIFLAPV